MSSDLDIVPAFDELASSEDTVYVLSADRRLLRTNRGWARFASANGGQALLEHDPTGLLLDDVLPDSLRDLYVRGFEGALATSKPWEHEYECSSPRTFRRFRMIAYPSRDRQALLVVSSLLVEVPHPAEPFGPVASAYTHRGLITMCANCRRVRNVEADQRWDWVPAWVERMPTNVSHGLCPPCVRFLYG